jgi:electron transport complex protein RnfG
MKSSGFVSMTVTLVLVAAVAAVSLGFVYKVTKEPIAQAKLEKKLLAIEKVGGAYDNDPLSEAVSYALKDLKEVSADVEGQKLVLYPLRKSGVLVNVVVHSYSEQGYSGLIEIMVGFDLRGNVRDIEVLGHKETPGLGSKINDKEFKGQYFGKSPETNNLKVTKDDGEIDAISGATISSRAFSEAVESAFKVFKAYEK